MDRSLSEEGFHSFLREGAAFLGLRWRPFQKRGIRRKLERRISEIGLPDFDEYLSKIKEDPSERDRLSKILKITISRFFRDREVFETIENSVIPAVIGERGQGDLKIWSIGCASGEEPYSLQLLWKERFERFRPDIRLSLLATDIDEHMLERAKAGRYKKSSLKEVPAEIVQKYFKAEKEMYVLDRAIREKGEFRRHDILRDEPFSDMDLVFCRNLAFTYFSKKGQIETLRKIALSLRGNGYLIIGKDEPLPLLYPTLFVPVFPKERIFRKFNAGESPFVSQSL
jgi:chemotaxis methyl-accepting protein methylase